MSNSLQPCRCGYGDHWYCYGFKSEAHEFNRGDQPMARYYADRNPEAKVFGHISGKYAVVTLFQGDVGKRFKYSEAGRDQAFADAVHYVKSAVDRQPEEQFDLFGGVG